MSEELVVLNGAIAPVSDSNFEVDFSEVKQIKPLTLSIDQPTTQKDGLKPGFIRTNETGDLREAVKVVLIAKPRETRKMQIGKFPDKKTVCFSVDMKVPHRDSVDQQALACAGCKQASWERYNKTKNDDDKPHCEITSNISLIDYDYCIPVKMYASGLSRTNKGDGGGWENGIQQILQRFVAIKLARGTASWTDVAFTLTTKKVKGKPTYALYVKDVHPVTPEERTHLSGIMQLVSGQKAAILAKDAEEEQTQQHVSNVERTNHDIADAVSMNPATTSSPMDGEYVQGSVEDI
jgi:hypothetical protein